MIQVELNFVLPGCSVTQEQINPLTNNLQMELVAQEITGLDTKSLLDFIALANDAMQIDKLNLCGNLDYDLISPYSFLILIKSS